MYDSSSSEAAGGYESENSGPRISSMEKKQERFQKVGIRNKTVEKIKNNRKSANVHNGRDANKIIGACKKENESNEKDEDVRKNAFQVLEQKNTDQSPGELKNGKLCNANMQNNLSTKKVQSLEMDLACDSDIGSICNSNSNYNSNSNNSSKRLPNRKNGINEEAQDIFSYNLTNYSPNSCLLDEDSGYNSLQKRYFKGEMPVCTNLYQRCFGPIHQHLSPLALSKSCYEDCRSVPVIEYDMFKISNKASNGERHITDEQKQRILAKSQEIRTYEATLGILKLRRIFKDGTYQDQGYKYKSDFQIRVLTDILKITPYPGAQTRDTLAVLLNLNPRSIQIWFQNARQSNDAHLTKDKLKSHKIKNYIDTLTIIEIYFKNLNSRK